jgi:YggT family protein
MNALNNVAYFLIDTLFSLYIALFMVRLLLGMSRADFYNPISQFVVIATNPVLKFFRRFVPPVGKIDTAAIVAMLLLKMLHLALLVMLKGHSFSFIALLWASIIQLLTLLIYVYIFALIIQAVMSWVNPQGQSAGNPMWSIVNSITRPIVAPISRLIPPIGMIDLSPLIAILGLNVLLIVLQSL